MYSYILSVCSYRIWAFGSRVQHRTHSHKVVGSKPSVVAQHISMKLLLGIIVIIISAYDFNAEVKANK